MKKLNILFAKSHKRTIDKLDNDSMNSMSEIARAAMTIGLKEIERTYADNGLAELYALVKQNQGEE